MAENIDIKLQLDSRQAQQNLDKFKGGIDRLKGAFAALSGIAVVGQLTRIADQATELKNRLTVLTGSQEKSNKLFNELVDVANRSRSPLAAVGDLYFRIGKSADTLGISQQEALEVTETVSKAITASGISAAEAAGPLLQLGQALQAGRLQGDELRSILEGLPPVSRALADSLGVPVGALKELGAAGVLSSKDVIRALQEAKGAIERDFANTVPTIGQAFGIVTNSLTQFVSKVDGAGGVSGKLAQSIVSLATNIDKLTKFVEESQQSIKSLIDFIIDLGKNLLYVAAAFAVFRVGVAIFRSFGAIIAQVKDSVEAFYYLIIRVFQAFKRGGVEGVKKWFEVLIAAAGGADAALKPLLQLFLGNRLGALIADNLKTAIGSLIAFGKTIFDVFSGPVAESVRGLQADVRRVDNALEATAETAKNSENAFKKLFDVEFSKQIADYQRINRELIEQARLTQSQVGLSEQQRDRIQAQVDVYRKYQEQLDKVTEKQRELTEAARAAGAGSADEAKLNAFLASRGSIIAQITEQYRKTAVAVAELTEGTIRLQEAERARQFSLEQQTILQDELTRLADEYNKMGLSEVERKLYDVAAAADARAEAEIRAANAARGAGNELSIDEEAKIYDRARAGVDQLSEAIRRNHEASRTWNEGWRAAFQEYTNNATNAAQQARDTFNSVVSNMGSALDKFVETGKLNFGDLAKSIIQDIIKIQLRAQAAKIFSSVFGFGGFGGGGGGLTLGGGFANGGNPPIGKASIVGENGPELIVPRTAQTVIPNHAMGGTSATYVTYNINAIDSQSFEQRLSQNPKLLYGITKEGERQAGAASFR